MRDDHTLWVMGHKIRPINTDDSYGLVEVTSPPHVPGPPPHYHRNEREFLLVMKGVLDVMSGGTWQKLSAGGFVDLPPNTTHTFINNTEEEVVWITGWYPKGFQRFFEDFGIATHEAGAQQRSTAPDVIQRVVQRVQSYGMYIAN